MTATKTAAPKTFESVLGLSYEVIANMEGETITVATVKKLPYAIYLFFSRTPQEKGLEDWIIAVSIGDKPCHILTSHRIHYIAKELGLIADGKLVKPRPPIDYNQLIELLIIEGLLTTDIYEVMKEKYDELQAALAAEAAA